MEHRQPIHGQPKVNGTVVVVQPENRAEPPPSYQVATVHQEKTTFNTLATTLEEAENQVAGLALSEVDVSNSKSPTEPEVLIKPPPKLIEVQEKVRCLAINKRERRDARRAEKAMKIEAWKERKQAKRVARAAWREERRAVRA